MAEQLSNGYNATVYRVTPQERVLYPRADLKRVESSGKDFRRLYYTHAIASTLFPANFIQVSGVNRIPSDIPCLPQQTSTFSKEVLVPPDHQIFSSHMAIEKTGQYPCECGACLSHRDFHGKTNLEGRAYGMQEKFDPLGIVIPASDASDYCVNQETGSITFFEVDYFFPDMLRRYLDNLEEIEPRHRKARRLLDRYDTIVMQLKEEKDKLSLTS